METEILHPLPRLNSIGQRRKIADRTMKRAKIK